MQAAQRPDVKLLSVAFALAVVGGLIGLVIAYAIVVYSGSPAFSSYVSSIISQREPGVANQTALVSEVLSIMKGVGYYLLAISAVGVVAGMLVEYTRRVALSLNIGRASGLCTSLGVLLIVLGVMSLIDIVELILFIAAGALLLHERTALRRFEAIYMTGAPANVTA